MEFQESTPESNGGSSTLEQNLLQNKNTLQILRFNVRSLLDFQRRQIFANEIAKKNYDVHCLTETWSTSDIPVNAFLPTGYTTHRTDRTTENINSKHGGVLIAVKDIPHYRLKNTTHSESVSIALQTPTESLVICCMYNPPESSPYRAPASQFHETQEEIKKWMKQRDNYTLIVSCDLNLPGVDWNSMLSEDEYDLSLFNNSEAHRLQQILLCKQNQSLDVCLTQSHDSIELAEINKNLTRDYSINGKRCSDHQAFRTTISIDTSAKKPAPKVKHAYHKADWKNLTGTSETIFFHPTASATSMNLLTNGTYGSKR